MGESQAQTTHRARTQHGVVIALLIGVCALVSAFVVWHHMWSQRLELVARGAIDAPSASRSMLSASVGLGALITGLVILLLTLWLAARRSNAARDARYRA